MSEPRRVVESDVPTVVAMVHELADFELAPEKCHLTEQQLRTALFAPAPALFGHVCEVDGGIAGFALWFLNFSTWEGVHGIYLEDLYVRPAQRGRGVGALLLRTLAGEAVANGYARLDWSVLDWNAPAIEFYKSVGAVGMDEWTGFRLTGPALSRFAEGT